MKLYYATGTCSLSPHIVALEAGIALDFEKVNLARTPHPTETGAVILRQERLFPNGSTAIVMPV